MGLFDHVGKEDDFDLIKEENFTDGFKDFEDGIFGSVLTWFGNTVEEGVDPSHVIFGVETEHPGILGGCIVDFSLVFVH